MEKKLIQTTVQTVNRANNIQNKETINTCKHHKHILHVVCEGSIKTKVICMRIRIFLKPDLYSIRAAVITPAKTQFHFYYTT